MKFPALTLGAVAFFRLACLFPRIIDDDEAWWAASAHALSSPWEFYRRAVDPKPPGVVWIYWLWDRMAPSGIADPRVARAFFVLCCFAGAWMLGVLASRPLPGIPGSRRDPGAGGLAAAFFLLASAAPSVKLFSFTAEGLLAVISTGIFGLAFLSESLAAATLCGMLWGIALLIKQTAVFFAIPLFLKKRPWSRLGMIVVGAALMLVPAILALGPEEFLYWNWSYPLHDLTTSRKEIFGAGSQLIENGILFAGVTAPLVWAAGAWMVRMRGACLQDYRFLWLLASAAAMALGRGLFLHYFLLCVPPLCLLAVEELCLGGHPGISARGGLAWMAIPYFAQCALLMAPFSGVFWGLDLPYFQAVSRTIHLSLRNGQRILIWGGSPLPLIDGGHPHVTRFVLPHFAEPPYSNSYTNQVFHRELTTDPPALVVDLHQRGDNRFSNPIESDPVLDGMLRKGYQLYLLPTLPWAGFYFRAPPLPEAGLVRVPEERIPGLEQQIFPPEHEPWLAFLQPLRQNSWIPPLHALRILDQKLRAQASLELLEKQSMDAGIEIQAHRLLRRLKEEPWSGLLHQEIEPFLSTPSPPLPWRSFLWWPEVAIVQLQPRALPAKTP